jgi:MFS family permease
MIAANSLAGVFDTPARQSIVPLLVPKEQFVNAVSLNTTMWHTAIVLGPSISGFVIAALGVSIVYAFNSATFLVSFIAIVLMTKVGRETTTRSSFSLASVSEGLRFVFRTPLILSSMLLDFFATFFSSATVLLPIFAKEILSVGPQGLGILYAAPSLGAVTGGLFISSFRHVRNQGKLLISAVLFYGAATFLFGFTRHFALSLILLYLTGMGDVVSTIIRNTIRQMTTPDHLRGRMVSVNMIFFMGGPQLGEVEAGLLAAVVGTPASVAIGGLGTIIATLLIAYLVPKLRKYRGDEIIV